MPVSVETLRVLEPCPGVLAYYDGRIPGRRLHGDAPNWLDDGAYELGTASYAIVEGEDALVYDTHMSLAHAAAIRANLAARGVTRLRVALSHGHTDHVAGNAVFADGEIIALRLTADYLTAERAAMEGGDPPIAPLVMPTTLFDTRLDLMVGTRRVELHHMDIHSRDGAVLWLPDVGVLLAGDTLEDPVTYVSEPDRLAQHLRDLDRLRGWPITKILPNHGDPARIAAGGYDVRLIDATRRYVTTLLDPAARRAPEAGDLARFIAADVEAGVLGYWPAYEAVHRRNLAVVEAAEGERTAG